MYVRAFLRHWRLMLAAVVVLAVVFAACHFIAEFLRWTTYTSSTPPVFSIKHLVSSPPIEDYINPLLPLDSQPRGVKFDIPQELLGASHVLGGSLSVEYRDASYCSPAAFLPRATSTVTLVEDGVTYLVGSRGYGEPTNSLIETVYVIKDSTPCFAVRYSLHTSIRAGFDQSGPPTQQQPSVRARSFDYPEAVSIFDTMRRSLKLK